MTSLVIVATARTPTVTSAAAVVTLVTVVMATSGRRDSGGQLHEMSNYWSLRGRGGEARWRREEEEEEATSGRREEERRGRMGGFVVHERRIERPRVSDDYGF